VLLHQFCAFFDISNLISAAEKAGSSTQSSGEEEIFIWKNKGQHKRKSGQQVTSGGFGRVRPGTGGFDRVRLVLCHKVNFSSFAFKEVHYLF
jgi:hypothetical protein